MPVLNFVKMAGAGNDFILVDNRTGRFQTQGPRLARHLCSRRNSVGADGLIFLESSRKANVKMRVFNPDGTQAAMCGNGVRCLARFAQERVRGLTNEISVETLAGIIRAKVRPRGVVAQLTDPKGLKLHGRLHVGTRGFEFHFINTGVPHTVLVAESLKNIPVEKLGRAIRTHVRFAPQGTNVDFIQLNGKGTLWIRTYERGVEAETSSCGTGAVAGALVASRLYGLESPVTVRPVSGETLKVYFAQGEGPFSGVGLEGPVQKIFEGRIQL